MGTDGNQIVYPVRGIVQAVKRDPQRQTTRLRDRAGCDSSPHGSRSPDSGLRLESPLTVLALCLAAAAAERLSLRFAVTRRGLTSTEELRSPAPDAFRGGAFRAARRRAVGAASMLGDPELISQSDPDRAPRLKWATYTSTRFMSGAIMGFVAQATLELVPSVFGALVAASLLSAVAGEVLDVFFSALTARVRGRPAATSVGASHRSGLTSAVVYAPLVALLAYMYVRVSPWTLALFLIPAMAVQRLYGLYQEQRQLAADLSVANDTLERANLQFAAALIATLDARDQYTAGHSAAVAIYSATSRSGWGSRRRRVTRHICADSCTTSARSAYRPGSSRNRAR